MGINASARCEVRGTEMAMHFVCCSCANAYVSCFGMSDIREKLRPFRTSHIARCTLSRPCGLNT